MNDWYVINITEDGDVTLWGPFDKSYAKKVESDFIEGDTSGNGQVIRLRPVKANEYKVYTKSILSDAWGNPVLITQDEKKALDLAYVEFDDHGQWSIVTKNGEPYYVDYSYVSGRLEAGMTTEAIIKQHFEGRTDT